MRTSALFGAKNFGFFEIYDVSARTRKEGIEPMRTRGRSIFRDFVQMSFMDGPLTKDPFAAFPSCLIMLFVMCSTFACCFIVFSYL